jgi:hypothetical protein
VPLDLSRSGARGNYLAMAGRFPGRVVVMAVGGCSVSGRLSAWTGNVELPVKSTAHVPLGWMRDGLWGQE